MQGLDMAGNRNKWSSTPVAISVASQLQTQAIEGLDIEAWSISGAPGQRSPRRMLMLWSLGRPSERMKLVL